MGDLHLAVALDGYGWHPQARHTTLSRFPSTASVLSGRYWAELATVAERGLLDFVTIHDAFTPQGRADAVMLAARMAVGTAHIGLVPVATVTHTEPFHVATAIATLDFVSHGRAGWQPRVSSTAHEAALFGRRDPAPPSELFAEAAEVVDVVRRLWDSWEDDAVIRDVASGRYVDRDRLHYVDFRGRHFSVKGPSITPRPPQGQPVVAALARGREAIEFAAAAADIVFVTANDDDELRAILARFAAAGGDRLRVYADVPVGFDGDGDLDPGGLAELIVRRHRLGVDGVRLRPAVHAADLPVIVDEVVPLLQRTGRYRTSYPDGETLRQRVGLPAAVNRYATGAR